MAQTSVCDQPLIALQHNCPPNDTSHSDNATRSGWFDVVYESDDCRIYHIRDQKGAAPDEKKTDDDKPGDDDNAP